MRGTLIDDAALAQHLRGTLDDGAALARHFQDDHMPARHLHCIWAAVTQQLRGSYAAVARQLRGSLRAEIQLRGSL